MDTCSKKPYILTAKNLVRKIEQARVNLGKIFTDQEKRPWVLRNPKRAVVQLRLSLELQERIEEERLRKELVERVALASRLKQSAENRLKRFG